MALIAEEEPWLLVLPILACLAVGGNIDNAIPVAAAWATLRHAANLLDAVQDGHKLPSLVIDEPAKAIGCATGLIFNAFEFVNRINAYPEITKRIMAIYAEAGFDASVGQHMGMEMDAWTSLDADSLERYWTMVILKSGNIFRAGMVAGAALGTDNHEQITALGGYGTALGVIRQVLDDCRDMIIDPASDSYESTLPLLLYSLSNRSYASGHIEDISLQVQQEHLTKRELFSSLSSAHVPETIADVLMEWKRRAMESLQIFERSNAVVALENITNLVFNYGDLEN
jgi:geranylgeranyl pyrophosphate synthase